MLVRKLKIGPGIVEVAWGSSLGSIVPFPAEDGDETKRVWGPDCGSTASADDVIYKRHAVGTRYRYGSKHAVLVGIADSLPPNPQSGTVLILPDVVQESGRVRGTCTVSPATVKPKIAVGIAPTNGAPTRPGHVSCRAGTQVAYGLCSIVAGLIREVAPRYPIPLLGRNIIFPQIVQDRTGRRRAGVAGPCRIESKSPKEPDVARRVCPQHRRLAPTWGGRPASCSRSRLSRVNSFLIDNVG